MQINFSNQFPEPAAKFLETGTGGGGSEKLPAKVESGSKKEEKIEPDKTRRLQNALAEHDISLNFKQDEETKQLVVELIDAKTGDAIRQIPTEVSLKLSASFAKLQGQLVDERL